MAFSAVCIIPWLRRAGGVGTLVIGSAASLFAQGGFGGPSILSRPTGALLSPENPPFLSQFYGSVNWNQEFGLLPVATPAPTAGTPAVAPVSTDLSGLEANFGALFRKRLRRSEFGFGYVGNERTYTNGGQTSSDHLVDLEFQRQIAQHVQLSVRGTAGSVSRSIGGVLNSPLISPEDASLPTVDVFDSRYYFGRLQADVLYRQSGRLSYRLGFDTIQVRRNADALLSVGEVGMSGDVAYRLSRNQTMSVQYEYQHLGYNHGVGTFDISSLGGGYSRRLGRYWQLELMGGIYRIESFGNETVPLDPAVAALLGQTSGLQLVYKVDYKPQVDAHVNRHFQRGVLNFGYSRRLNPGNGLLALSSQSVVGAGYTRNVSQKFSVNVDANYSKLDGIRGGNSSYSTTGASLGSQYRLWRNAYWSLQFGYRTLDATDILQSQRPSYRLSTGLAFRSSDIPLRFR